MAMYLAKGIMDSRLDYAAVFSRPIYLQFKDAVDDILIAEGRHDLIV
ncbi:MAG TPA: hypothetical protein GX708_14370 [Gallicola sp.]|nr:hypothetical protein [Gallicola sp.]